MLYLSKWSENVKFKSEFMLAQIRVRCYYTAKTTTMTKIGLLYDETKAESTLLFVLN